jgi:glycosyltransferase involved in cell wall biosynthesis
MKIVYVINTLGCGGAERHLLFLVNHMISSRHSVLVVALNDNLRGGAKNLESAFSASGASIIVLFRKKSNLLTHLRSLFSLHRIICLTSPDIVHSHLPRSDFITSFVSYLSPKAAWVSTIHDAYIKGVFSGYWLIPFLGWNWRRCDHIIAVSSYVRSWVANTLLIKNQDCTVIGHGISLPSIRPQPPTYDHTPFTVGCLARYEPRKGIATLIHSVSILSRRGHPIRLLISGSDPNGYSDYLRKLSKELSVSENVDILAFSDDPFEFLSMLDVFALASSCEGFGIVVLEAMASRLPVVASNIQPLNEIVNDGITGFLCDHEDPTSFAVAFQRLAEDTELIKRMGEAGLTRCAKSFSLETMLQSTESLYRHLSNRKHRK